MKSIIKKINFKKGSGFVPIIVRDFKSKEILMLGYGNKDSLSKTLAERRLYLWSRSRNELWLKGKKSGNFLFIKKVHLDCDNDAVLADVVEATSGTPICHTGRKSCFTKEILKNII